MMEHESDFLYGYSSTDYLSDYLHSHSMQHNKVVPENTTIRIIK